MRLSDTVCLRGHGVCGESCVERMECVWRAVWSAWSVGRAVCSARSVERADSYVFGRQCFTLQMNEVKEEGGESVGVKGGEILL